MKYSTVPLIISRKLYYLQRRLYKPDNEKFDEVFEFEVGGKVMKINQVSLSLSYSLLEVVIENT